MTRTVRVVSVCPFGEYRLTLRIDEQFNDEKQFLIAQSESQHETLLYQPPTLSQSSSSDIPSAI